VTPAIALREAIFALLKGSAAVVALCAAGVDGVHDQVPAGPAPASAPYVYLGPVNRTRIETGGEPAWEWRLRLFVIATDFDRDTAWELAEAVIDALEGEQPALAGGHELFDLLRVRQAGDVIEPVNPKAVFVDVGVLLNKAAA
jgi:Protein of unknown function (DUF3168)